MASNQARMKCYRALFCAFAYLLFLFSKGESERIAPFAAATVLLISLGMMLLKDTRLLTLPFLLLCQMLIFCYDSFDFVKCHDIYLHFKYQIHNLFDYQSISINLDILTYYRVRFY